MRARAWITTCALAVALATNAPTARASDDGDDDGFLAGFPSFRMGFGWGAGTMCGDDFCRRDHAISGIGGISPRRGVGGWADMALHFSARDLCLGIDCGDLPGTAALTGGIARRDGRWHGAVGLGVAYTGAAFDPLWKYVHAVQTTATASVALWRGDDLEVSIEARGMMSLAPFGALKMATVGMLVGL